MNGSPNPVALGALRKATFNLDLATYAHPTWVGPLARLPDPNLWRSSRAVSRWIASETGVNDLFDWRMKEVEKRIFLMTPTEIRKAALTLGVSLQAPSLSRQIRREEVTLQRAAFGESLLAFAFDEASRHHLPAVEAPHEADAREAKQLRQAAYRLGAQTMWHMLHSDWRAVRLRAALMFDKRWRLADGTGRHEEWHAPVRAFLINAIVPQRLPQCAWLF